MLLGRAHAQPHLLRLADNWHVSPDAAHAAADTHAVFAAAKDLVALLLARSSSSKDAQRYAEVAADVLLSVQHWSAARRAELLDEGSDGSDNEDATAGATAAAAAAAGSGKGKGKKSKQQQQQLLAQQQRAARKAAAAAAVKAVAVPLDLATKLAVCYMHMGNLDKAAEGLRGLMKLNSADEAVAACLAEAGEVSYCSDKYRMLVHKHSERVELLVYVSCLLR
jgi:hypothetical protein